MVRSMLRPSIFALLPLVCLLSVLPKPGHATKCKYLVESELMIRKPRDRDCNNEEKCFAQFCSTQNGLFLFNAWNCIGMDMIQEQCDTLSANKANGDRAQLNISKVAVSDWKCKCTLGNAGEDMANANFESPEAKMACKYRMESENAELNEQLNNKLNKKFNNNEKIQCIKEKGKCGAVFCKTKDGELKWNKWACFSADYSKKVCAKNETNAVNDERDKWSDSKLPKADDWKCRCRFGGNGKDLTNNKFVPRNSTAIRHGDGMPMIVVGIIMAILPPFHHAILDQLQMN